MEMNKFNELIAKYWEGTSSLEEEDQLRSYLQTSEGSSKYPKEASMFGFFHLQKEVGTNITEFPTQKIEETKIRRLGFTNVRNIAAALLLVLGAYFVWNNNISSSQTDIKSGEWTEIDDPKKALEITKQALAFLSHKVDKSEQLVKQNIAQLSVNKILKK